MIRFAKQTDICSIIALWSEAFGDKEEDIRFFLDNRFIPENTVVFVENGEVVSMLFLLEGDLIIDNKSYSSYYLYAACTSVSQRGRGIMANLLEKAKETAENRGKYFICLMPGEPSLFDFYKRFGYKSIFSRKILSINNSDLNNDCKGIQSEENDLLVETRKNAFGGFNRFEWDENAIRFACKHHLLYGGKALVSCKGYALYSTNANELTVKEFTFSPDNLENAAAKLLSECKTDNIIIHLPSDYPTDIGRYEIKKSAMALAVKNDYEQIIEEVNNAYLGLTLD